MNIQQAILTGQVFKRPDHNRYLRVDNNGAICIQGTNHHYEFTADDIISVDWEILARTITITEAELIDRINAARSSLYTYKSHHYVPGETDLINAIIKELFPSNKEYHNEIE